ncbi:hypothetical protein FNF29_01440 [Cafeteria roenbergensis]|uniref:Protein tweety homolog n=1 Tax=Cafeteria roenbergensis TaxID=33653 RepID=A0A5A8CSA6_CAFRO|nr:hypothetical protein FNF29_01440 [Cafeteria roenbergensis]|eukprot:KAA0156022.1 hypothetical protein FNF29_01440 [Cafeteria roenbergensis]
MALDGSIEFLHSGTPRYFGGASLPDALIKGDIMAQSSQDYLLSLVVLAGIIAGVGLLVSFIMCSLSCCACCRCCWFRGCSQCRQGDIRSCLLTFLLLACAAFVGIGYGAVAPATQLTQAFSATAESVSGLGKHISSAAVDISAVAVRATSLHNDTAALLARVQALSGGGATYQDSIARLAALETALNGSTDALARSVVSIHSVAKPLSSFGSYTSNPDAKRILELAPLAAMAGFASIVVVLGLTLAPCFACCRFFHRAATGAVNVFLLLLWVTAGVVFAVALIAADACHDSGGTARQAARVFERSSPPTLGPSVDYYTLCNPLLKTDPVGVNMTNTPVQQVRNAHARLVDVEGDVERLRRDLPSPSQFPQDPESQQHGNAVIEGFGDVFRRTLALLRDNLECDDVRPQWDAVASSACSGVLVRGLVPLWAMQLGAGSTLVIVLVFNLVPCVRHPGQSDEESWEEVSAAPRAVDPMENSRTMQGGALRATDGTELASRQAE